MVGLLGEHRAAAQRLVTLAMSEPDRQVIVDAAREVNAEVLSLVLIDLVVLTHQRWALELGLSPVEMRAEWGSVCADLEAWRQFGPPQAG